MNKHSSLSVRRKNSNTNIVKTEENKNNSKDKSRYNEIEKKIHNETENKHPRGKNKKANILVTGLTRDNTKRSKIKYINL